MLPGYTKPLYIPMGRSNDHADAVGRSANTPRQERSTQ